MFPDIETRKRRFLPNRSKKVSLRGELKTENFPRLRRARKPKLNVISVQMIGAQGIPNRTWSCFRVNGKGGKSWLVESTNSACDILIIWERRNYIWREHRQIDIDSHPVKNRSEDFSSKDSKNYINRKNRRGVFLDLTRDLLQNSDLIANLTRPICPLPELVTL